MDIKNIKINGQKIELNSEGFLIDQNSWNKAIATAIANQEGIDLSKEHWQLLTLLQTFYQEHQTIPPLRVFIKTVKINLGDALANSIAIHKLFGDIPLKMACKIAGLPKPKHCM